ncbi:MAG: histidinol dehydrogenase [Verrucomicrobia bacterium]|nr:histidinol dehydrogenase [Verrucomicrobiota bacterium]MDA1064920.1 histidinol dehydrogenase [Verrucomicrobiota bacterium]
MPTFKYGAAGFYKRLKSFAEDAAGSSQVEIIVSDILKAIETSGDSALFEITERLDGAKLNSKSLRVSEAELKAGEKSLSAKDRKAIRESIKNVQLFNHESLPKNWSKKNLHGATVGERYYPIRRVGIYVPGGTVPLVSTVVMTTTLARIAKVPEICVCTPPNVEGEIAPAMAGVLSMCEIKEVYKIGGAQAVAAMAYGTKSVSPVDKIYGPGNAYVNEAKRQLFGRVGIDLLPGPSELMVIADSTAEPRFVAADLLAQAEHGSGKERVYLVSTSEKLIEAVNGCLKEQLPSLGHKDSISKVLKKNYAIIPVPDLDAAIDVANFIAPEHMELQVEPNKISYLSNAITTAGAILQGRYSATALGDFTAGPSHELPTGRVGRFLSGLTIGDFFRRSSIVRYEQAHLQNAAETIEVFARLENLDAHGRSVSIRAK